MLVARGSALASGQWTNRVREEAGAAAALVRRGKAARGGRIQIAARRIMKLFTTVATFSSAPHSRLGLLSPCVFLLPCSLCHSSMSLRIAAWLSFSRGRWLGESLSAELPLPP